VLFFDLSVRRKFEACGFNSRLEQASACSCSYEAQVNNAPRPHRQSARKPRQRRSNEKMGSFFGSKWRGIFGFLIHLEMVANFSTWVRLAKLVFYSSAKALI
jgi:hypothetical protein